VPGAGFLTSFNTVIHKILVNLQLTLPAIYKISSSAKAVSFKGILIPMQGLKQEMWGKNP